LGGVEVLAPALSTRHKDCLLCRPMPPTFAIDEPRATSLFRFSPDLLAPLGFSQCN